MDFHRFPNKNSFKNKYKGVLRPQSLLLSGKIGLFSKQKECGIITMLKPRKNLLRSYLLSTGAFSKI
jgi:hypothetical protein